MGALPPARGADGGDRAWEWRLTAAGMRANLRAEGAALDLYRKTHGQIRENANGATSNIDTPNADVELTESEVVAGAGVEEEDEDVAVERPMTRRGRRSSKPLTIELLAGEHDEIDLQPLPTEGAPLEP
ncbi:MAG: hypothetical protein R3A52_25140 [Polyangiales bacterium]